MLQTRNNAYGATAAAPSPHRTMPLLLWLLGVGLVVCIGIASRGRFIQSDRFYYPKEFALQVFAVAMAVTAAARAGALRITRLDALLLAFLGWSGVAALQAPNLWWALGAFGETAAGLVVFWVARSLRDQGHERVLLGLVALAVAIVAGAALLEAYGAFRVSVGSRVPGGVLGNRNQMAHFLVLGTPTLLLFAIGLRRRLHGMLIAAVLMGIAMALVLSRARGAWLTAMLLAGTVILSLPLTRRVLRAAVSRRRAALWAGAAVAGAVVAVLLPNALDWKSRSPYRSTLSRILEYETGTGRGRLLQHANTLSMIGDNPLLGVGPGNWSVRYAEYAPPGDPSLYPEEPVPVWRYPSGEWIGIAAEAGLPALALVLGAGWVFLRGSLRGIRQGTDDGAVLRGLALASTLLGLALIGIVDPVLRVPAQCFLAFVILGALAPRERAWLSLGPAAPKRPLRVALVLLLLLPGAAFTGRQLWASLIYSTSAEPERLGRAVTINPGDYRAHVMLATAWIDRDRCDLARPHIEHARALYPAAAVPARLKLQCLALQTGGP